MPVKEILKRGGYEIKNEISLTNQISQISHTDFGKVRGFKNIFKKHILPYLVKRAVFNKFDSAYKKTIGVDYESTRYVLQPDINIQLQIWDIAGEQRFGSGRPYRAYYKDTKIFYFVCDLTRAATSNAITKWINHIRTARENAVSILLLNKSNCAQAHHYTFEVLQTYIDTHQIHAYIEVDAKAGIEVAAAFRYGIDLYYQQQVNKLDIKDVDFNKPKTGCVVC